MSLPGRMRAVEQTADRHRAPELRSRVCDRIEDLTVAFLIDPPTFAPAVEAGIRAAVERHIIAEEQFLGDVPEVGP